MYYDNASPKDDDPTQVGNIEKNKYSYNSGQPLQLACLLYKITQEDSYLNLAKQIAEVCHNKWFKQFHSDILKRDFKVLSPGHAWFNTIMCRGFFELYSIDKNSLYLEDIHSTMLHAWFGKAHHNNGLINNEDLSGLSGDIPAEDGGNKWQILHQGALVELYARLAVWEKNRIDFLVGRYLEKYLPASYIFLGKSFIIIACLFTSINSGVGTLPHFIRV